MKFTEERKQTLLELINNLQPNIESKSPGRIVLPLRLLVSTLGVLEEVYDRETLSELSEAEIRLFLNSFHSSVSEISEVLRLTISLLPDGVPPKLVKKNDDIVLSLQQMSKEREELLQQIDAVNANRDEMLAQQKQLEDLKQRKESLLKVKGELERTSIDSLRRDVANLEASVGPLETELLRLQAKLETKRKVVNPLQEMIETTWTELSSYERSERGRDELFRIIRTLESALQPHIHQADETLRAAQNTLREKMGEAERLLQDSKDTVDKVGQAFISIRQTQALLSAHAAADVSVAEALPQGLQASKEILKAIESQLNEIASRLKEVDASLKEALEAHQRSSATIQQFSL